MERELMFFLSVFLFCVDIVSEVSARGRHSSKEEEFFSFLNKKKGIKKDGGGKEKEGERNAIPFLFSCFVRFCLSGLCTRSPMPTGGDEKKSKKKTETEGKGKLFFSSPRKME